MALCLALIHPFSLVGMVLKTNMTLPLWKELHKLCFVISSALRTGHDLQVFGPRLPPDVLEAERARGVRPAEDGELRVCRQRRRRRQRPVRLGEHLRLYRRQRRAPRGEGAGQCCALIEARAPYNMFCIV